MANNVNPQAILVVNAKVRPACDKIMQTYNFMKALQAEYTAQGWAALFPADAGIVMDGSVDDGRTILTNTDINNIITSLSVFLTSMEATSNQHLNRYLKASVNPERI